MTILDYCQNLTSDANEKRLIILKQSDNSVLADAKILQLFNTHTKQDELCVTAHFELLESEFIDAIVTQTALTFIIMNEPCIKSLPRKVKLSSVSTNKRDLSSTQGTF